MLLACVISACIYLYILLLLWGLLIYFLPCADFMLGKGKLAELRAIARSHKLAAGSQTVPNSVVEIAVAQGKTPPQGPTPSGALPAPQRKKLILRKPKRKTPQVVQEEEEDEETTEDGLVTKRTRVAPSSPPAIPTPTPPSPPALQPPVQATPLAAAPPVVENSDPKFIENPQAPPRHSYLLERVLLQPPLLLGPHQEEMRLLTTRQYL